jgi:hypothetical protein
MLASQVGAAAVSPCWESAAQGQQLQMGFIGPSVPFGAAGASSVAANIRATGGPTSDPFGSLTQIMAQMHAEVTDVS